MPTKRHLVNSDTDGGADGGGAASDTGASTATASPLVNRPAVFATVALALLMMAVDGTIVATALHTLRHDLDTSINWAGWTLTAYSVGFVLMLPVSGKLSEQFGRRRVFLWSIIVFTLASLCCGLAGNIFVLIALRAVQAAGGAGFTPSATGIIVDYFGDARDRAVSLFGSIFPIGAMIGPMLGGLILAHWHWRGIFFVNLPIGLIVFGLTLHFIPGDQRRPAASGFHMDFPGMALFGCGLLAAMLAASYLGETGGQVAAPLLVLLAAAVVTLWLFFRHIHRTAQPFIAPRFISSAGFGAVNIANAIFSGIPIGAMALVPLYATNRYGFSPFDAASLLIAQGVATVAMAVAATLALRRTGYRLPLYIGTPTVAVGLLLLALPPAAGLSAYLWLAISAAVIGAGTGMINPASRNAGLQLAPQHSSVLAALRSLSLQIGSIITISLTTAFVTQAADAGSVQAHIYAALALTVLVPLWPVVRRIPEFRGAW